MIIFHHGLGTYIRNQFVFWRGDKALAPSDPISVWKPHPDSVSRFIIERLHRALNLDQKDFDYGIDLDGIDNLQREIESRLDKIKDRLNNG